VILPAWTWHSCFNAIVLAGALPVFAEGDDSFNIDPADFERKITPQTKAVMAVHLQGCPCDMDRVMAIARKHQVKVIEDCAQSVGASYKGKPLGSWGDIGIYSFQLNIPSPRARAVAWSPMMRSCSSGRRGSTTWAGCVRCIVIFWGKHETTGSSAPTSG
jgi:hypothetical protein